MQIQVEQLEFDSPGCLPPALEGGHHGWREYSTSERQFKLNAEVPNAVRADGTLPVSALLDTVNDLCVMMQPDNWQYYHAGHMLSIYLNANHSLFQAGAEVFYRRLQVLLASACQWGKECGIYGRVVVQTKLLVRALTAAQPPPTR